MAAVEKFLVDGQRTDSSDSMTSPGVERSEDTVRKNTTQVENT
jgi:hypothetical protein